MEVSKYECANCRSTQNLSKTMIIPKAQGGNTIETNYVTFCRSCMLAFEGVKEKMSVHNECSINFWVSKSFYEDFSAMIKNHAKFNSFGSVIRYMMKKYVDQQELFEDLENYQSVGTDIKINAKVNEEIYNQFRLLIADRGITATDAFKALILIYKTHLD